MPTTINGTKQTQQVNARGAHRQDFVFRGHVAECQDHRDQAGNRQGIAQKDGDIIQKDLAHGRQGHAVIDDLVGQLR